MPCPSAHTAGPALERAATSISGPRAAWALAGGAELVEPTSSRIILRLPRLSAAVLAEGVGSTACPSPHGSAQLDLTALRSVPSATRRPGAAGRCRAAQGRTRAVSACSTRAIRPALSRQSALPLGAQQCQLDLTACDRHGARRVGRAVQGGRAGRCWVPACGGGPLPKARTSCPGCTCAWSCGATHGTEARASAGEDERPARRPASVERVAHRDGAAASPKAARTARRRPEPERPSARACCWYL